MVCFSGSEALDCGGLPTMSQAVLMIHKVKVISDLSRYVHIVFLTCCFAGGGDKRIVCIKKLLQ